MAYVSDAAVKTYLAANLQIAESSLSAFHDTLIGRGNTAAYNTILGKLLERGFAYADILTWDRGEEFNLDLACCFVLRSAANLRADDTWQLKFCRTEELETVPVVVDGTLLTAGTAGIGYGDIAHADDVFSRDTEW